MLFVKETWQIGTLFRIFEKTLILRNKRGIIWMLWMVLLYNCWGGRKWSTSWMASAHLSVVFLGIRLQLAKKCLHIFSYILIKAHFSQSDWDGKNGLVRWICSWDKIKPCILHTRSFTQRAWHSDTSYTNWCLQFFFRYSFPFNGNWDYL